MKWRASRHDWGEIVFGLEIMETSDRLRAGVLVILALALECVLEGFATESEPRFWAFHGVAAGIAVWALKSFNDWAIRLSGLAGIAAVVNDGLLHFEVNSSLRLIIPSLVLFVAAGFVVYVSFSGEMSRSVRTSSKSNTYQVGSNTRTATRAGIQEIAGQFGEVSGALASVASIPNLKREAKITAADPTWVPFLLVGGAALTLFSMTIAKWVTVDALFGLIERSYDFDGLRSIYSDLGVRYFSRVFYFEWGFFATYVAVINSLIIAASIISKRFEVMVFLKTGALVFNLFSLVSHTGVVLGLNDAAEELLVLSGAWIGSLGLLATCIGIWLSGRK